MLAFVANKESKRLSERQDQNTVKLEMMLKSLSLIFLPRVQVFCSVLAAGKLRCSLQSHKHFHSNLNSWRTLCPTQSPEQHRSVTALTPSSQDQSTNSADYLYVTCKLLNLLKPQASHTATVNSIIPEALVHLLYAAERL